MLSASCRESDDKGQMSSALCSAHLPGKPFSVGADGLPAGQKETTAPGLPDLEPELTGLCGEEPGGACGAVAFSEGAEGIERSGGRAQRTDGENDERDQALYGAEAAVISRHLALPEREMAGKMSCDGGMGGPKTLRGGARNRG